MKKTQKLHRKTKSSKIRKTRKLQNGGLRPIHWFKNWRAQKKGTKTISDGVPIVTYNPGFVKDEVVYEDSERMVLNPQEYSGSYAKPQLTNSARERKIAKTQAQKKHTLKVRGEGSYASVNRNNNSVTTITA